MRTRLSDLTESLLSQRNDVKFSRATDDDPEAAVGFFGGPDYFDEACIYDPVDDATARWALSDWLDGSSSNLDWSVHLELSKLLAKRGEVIRGRVEPIVRGLAGEGQGGPADPFPWPRQQLCLSFLCRMPDGERLAVRLLELTPEDFRDGLLFACHRLNTPALYDAVKSSVRRWEQELWCPTSTGELRLVRRLLEQWDRTFPGGDHEDIRRLCCEPA